jgi:tetratricopeptide (TPR) repeat protein
MRQDAGRASVIFLLLVAGAAGLRAGQIASPVSARQDMIVLPTYEVGLPEPDPIFYAGRAYQGAQGPVYPYPFLDKLTDVKRDKAYRILYLENEYVRIGVLPEIGGRIFEAVDKTNGYDFVYRQHVIKPALIGMLGAWISGGVEWNIPHHHRASTFLPVDAAIVRGDDGGATIWVGEIELRHRMKWLVGLTLRPGSSLLEVTTKIFNRTPLAQSMLAFANVAVHADESYQVLFPPSTEIAAFHGKNQFSRWPVSTEVYNGQDYRKGVDVSWWKSHLTPTSFFAFDTEEDFFGGYDHGRRAGVVFIGDHNVVPGKKLWTWGTGSEGKTWERILTDADGPYLELMIGSFSDNQPDYSWIKPGETRAATQFWYPIRGLGGLKNANRDAACELEVAAGKARIAFCATSRRKRARCELRAAGRVLFADAFDIGPGEPYEKVVAVGAGADPAAMTLVLLDADGREVLRYAPRPKKNAPLPVPAAPPPAPKHIAAVEELYLAGQRLEQFHNPTVEPYPYYEEALRRDPSDSRTNAALGVLYLKRGLYREAEARLQRAVARITADYTRPKDGEALYYLGIAKRRLGKTAEAEDAFERAAWDRAWQSVSFLELAEMASLAGSYETALGFLDRSISAGGTGPHVGMLKAALLRRLGRKPAAAAEARAEAAEDPLDAWSLNETLLSAGSELETRASGPGPAAERLKALLERPVPNLLELALDYADAGLWTEAAELLAPPIAGAHGRRNPLAAYLCAYVLGRMGQTDRAREALREAAAYPPDYVFPFELEFIDILEWAMAENPGDARAPYYLGNLLFDLQPERAIACWEKSRALEPAFALVHRNLGWAYGRARNDLAAAVASLEKAVTLNERDARALFELDQLSEAAGTDPAVRLARLEKNRTVVDGNDNALAREARLLVLVGRPRKALDILASHHFHVWEGGGEIHGLWVEANLAAGRQTLRRNDFRGALASFLKALSYPVNLDVGAPSSGPGSPKIFYHIGQAQEGLGKKGEAAASFGKAASFPAGLTEQAYYAAAALAKLGRAAEAASCFEDLTRKARGALAAAPAPDFFEKFGERRSARLRQADLYFLAGLGLKGAGKAAEATAAFTKAVDLDPGHLEARRLLEEGRAP